MLSDVLPTPLLQMRYICARFSYASGPGVPMARIGVHPQLFTDTDGQILVGTVIQGLIDGLDMAGRDYHHRDSMPSLLVDDYRLVFEDKVLTTTDDLWRVSFEGEIAWCVCDLVYVGEVGPEQVDQARALGGEKAVYAIIEHVEKWRHLR